MDLPKHKGKHPHNALSAAFVRTAAPGYYCDGNGLYLRVDRSGARRWEQRLRIQGKNRTIGLGGYALVSLAEAREKALANRTLARTGGDPLALPRRSDIPTFREAAATVIDLHRPSWRNPKTPARWESTLRQYVYPRLGNKPIATITSADVMAVLMPIWNTRRPTARKIKQRISTVMKWAYAEGHIDHNPAGDQINAALPKNNSTERHLPAVPHTQVANTLAAIQASGAGMTIKLAIRYLVLTAARSSEVRGARWSEIDTPAEIWVVPAERMKTGREFRVPLSVQALDVLNEARQFEDGTGLVFPSPIGRMLSDNALSKLFRKLRIAGTPHGMRSAFRDWASERTNAPRAVMEQALAHIVGGVEGAYARSDLFERRRKLMQQWAMYLSTTSADILPISRIVDMRYI